MLRAKLANCVDVFKPGWQLHGHSHMRFDLSKSKPRRLTSGPLYIFLVISFAVAVWSTNFLSPESLSSDFSISFCSAVGAIFPSVFVMSQKAFDPARAQVTWALQWSFVPVYLGLWLYSMPPWSDLMTKRILENNKKHSEVGKRIISICLGILFLGLLILSDLRVVNLYSFARGIIFGIPFDSGPINEMSTLMRAPFSSKGGMILFAWFEPFFTSTMYWVFLDLTVNFMSYADDPADQFRSEESSKGKNPSER